MRVLYLTFDDLSRGGPWSAHVKRVASALDARVFAAPRRFERLSACATAFLKEARAYKPDVILTRGIHLSVAPALAAARAGVPLVVELDGLLEDQVRGKIRRSTIRAAHRFTLARAARVAACSEDLRDALVERYGFPAKRVDVGDVEASVRKCGRG
jgi:hypothetical protein